MKNKGKIKKNKNNKIIFIYNDNVSIEKILFKYNIF